MQYHRPHGHFFVTGTVEPHLELVGAVAAVDQVRVAVDQAWGDEGAAGIVLHRAACPPFGWQLVQAGRPRLGCRRRPPRLRRRSSRRLALRPAPWWRRGMGPQLQAHADNSIHSACVQVMCTVAALVSVRQTSVPAGTKRSSSLNRTSQPPNPLYTLLLFLKHLQARCDRLAPAPCARAGSRYAPSG